VVPLFCGRGGRRTGEQAFHQVGPEAPEKFLNGVFRLVQREMGRGLLGDQQIKQRFDECRIETRMRKRHTIPLKNMDGG
jgi:hypothetical protein